MDLLPMMLGMSLLLSFGFLFAFLWATKKSQFDDLVTPSWRAVFDDEPVKTAKKEGEKDAAAEV